MPTMQNIKLTNVPFIFDTLPSDGINERYYQHQHRDVDFDLTRYGLTTELKSSHIQGVAEYKDYLILSPNMEDRPVGFFVVLTKKDRTVVQVFYSPTHEKQLNHPAGMQVIGDVLVVGIEDGKNTTSAIYFYDLSVMNDETSNINRNRHNLQRKIWFFLCGNY